MPNAQLIRVSLKKLPQGVTIGTEDQTGQFPQFQTQTLKEQGQAVEKICEILHNSKYRKVMITAFHDAQYKAFKKRLLKTIEEDYPYLVNEVVVIKFGEFPDYQGL